VEVHLPPLRQRTVDLPVLVQRFLERAGSKLVAAGEPLVRLARYHWPGNVRELRNVIARAVALAGPDDTFADLPFVFRPTGAAPVFGPQKGADPARVHRLGQGLTRWAAALEAATGVATGDVPGTGAAGGVLSGLLAVAGATRASGFELVAEAVGLDARLSRADLVVTGEGRLDTTSFAGKVAGRLAGRCQVQGLRCLVIAGGVTPEGEALLAAAGGAALPLVPGPISLDAACAGAAELLEGAAGRLARLTG
jgi:glycerate kinase